MKNLLLTMILSLIMNLSYTQTLRVATYNIRLYNRGDSLDLWETRSPYLADLIELYDFDIFGTQEGFKNQLDYLKETLHGYDYIGGGRDDGAEKGEHSSIFYKTEKFKLLSKGDFWLSAITDKPNKGWDAAYVRICSWGKFQENATGKIFFMFNVHFDHLGKQAQLESAKLMVGKVKEIAGNTPAILTGDFNISEKSEGYNVIKTSGILRNSYDSANLRFDPNGTFNGFQTGTNPVDRIDHIFVTSTFTVKRYGILTNTYKGRYPSDHFPVFVEIGY